MLKIKRFESYQDLDEIYQSSKLMFSLLSTAAEGNKMCTPWVRCRDFLHDAVRAYLLNTPSEIYGFRYDRNKHPAISTRYTRIAVKGADKKTMEEIVHRAIKLINHYEEMAEFKGRSVLKRAEGNIWVFVGPSIWIKSPTLLSLYTLLIRLGEYKELAFNSHEDLKTKLAAFGKADGSNEQQYIYAIEPNKLDTLIKNIRVLFPSVNYKNYKAFADIKIYDFHNNAGIVSLCSNKKTYIKPMIKRKFEALCRKQ